MPLTQKFKKLLFWLGLSLPMAALLVMAWLVHQSGSQFNDSFNWIRHTYKVLDLYQQTQSQIVDAEAGQRGYLLTGQPEYIGPYQTAMKSIRGNLAELKKLTASDPLQQASLATLETLVDKELVFDPATAFSPGAPPPPASVPALTGRGQHRIQNLQQALFRTEQAQLGELSRRQQAAEAEVASSQFTSLVLIAAVALALILVVTLLRLERLQKFATVCAWTGQVKLQGRWLRLDEYLKRQFDISVSHSMSQEAADTMMKEIDELNRTNPPA